MYRFLDLQRFARQMKAYFLYRNININRAVSDPTRVQELFQDLYRYRICSKPVMGT